jgi:hypothetical protein
MMWLRRASVIAALSLLSWAATASGSGEPPRDHAEKPTVSVRQEP